VHEMSVALEICRMVEAHAPPYGLTSVVIVGIDIGDDAGVEPSNLEFCLDALLTHPPFRAAKPVLHRCDGDVLRVSYLEIDDGRSDN